MDLQKLGKQCNLPGAVNKGNMTKQAISALASITLTRRVNLLRTVVALVAGRPRASRVVTLVDLRIRITQLDRAGRGNQRLVSGIQTSQEWASVLLTCYAPTRS